MNDYRSRFLLTSAVLVVLAGMSPQVRAAELIRIENVVWGFDGKVVPHSFNPLSFEIYNDSTDQAEFELVLERTNGVAPVDAPIIQPISLAPNTGRRVQMFPYILNGWSDWTLKWGRGENQRRNLNQQGQLALGEPATVVVYDSLAVIPPGGGGLPRFDEAFFPISVSGTGGLASVVLDHDPRSWHESSLRAQAFLDWLHAGGTVHLLQSSEGVFPDFEAPLDGLNAPMDEYRVGAGRVIRHPITYSGLDRAYAQDEMIPMQTVRLKPEPEDGSQQQSAQAANTYSPYINWDTSELMFSRLRQMTRADHNWPLIYVMALVYLLVIFPGCWLIGRRRADYRVTYGVMLGAVVLFSMGFKSVGQRGYGEATALHTTTIARPVGEGRLLLQQWTNLFVTNGDDYHIAHPGNGLLYSSGQTNEAVRGIIVNPPGGRFDVDIPPFSSRTIASSAVLEDRPVEITTVAFNAEDSRLRDLRIQFDPALTESIVEACVLFQGKVYTLTGPSENEMSLRPGGMPFKNYLQTETWQDGNYGMPFYGWGEDLDINELFATAMRPLLARDLGIYNEETWNRMELANDRARLYVYADMPEELSPQCEYIDGTPLDAQKVGRVLYVIDVFPPDSEADEAADN